MRAFPGVWGRGRRVRQLAAEIGRLEVAMVTRLLLLCDLLPEGDDLRDEAVRLIRALQER